MGDSAWDPWDHFDNPIEAVRAALHVLPRDHEPVYLEYDEDEKMIVSS